MHQDWYQIKSNQIYFDKMFGRIYPTGQWHPTECK